MNKYLLSALMSSSLISNAFAVENTKKPHFKNDADKMSYIIGHDMGESLNRIPFKINKSVLLEALKDNLNGKKSSFTQEETMTFSKTYIESQQKLAGEANKKEGDTFFATNKTASGVVSLPSGLQYKILEEGKGQKPKDGEVVTVDYEGKFLNGKVFDSSYARGTPATFPVDGVIKGWTEALKLMPQGSTWMLYIPSSLAYGERGQMGIGPNSSLVFKVHLVSIAKKPESAPQQIPAPAELPKK